MQIKTWYSRRWVTTDRTVELDARICTDDEGVYFHTVITRYAGSTPLVEVHDLTPERLLTWIDNRNWLTRFDQLLHRADPLPPVIRGAELHA